MVIPGGHVSFPTTRSPRTLSRCPAAGAAVALAVVLAGVGCAKRDAESVRVAFEKRLAAVETVREVQRTGNTLTFVGPDGTGGDTSWRVQIDVLILGRNADPGKPYRADLQTSWYRDDQRYGDGEPPLPQEFLAQGLQPVLVAFWDERARRWTW